MNISIIDAKSKAINDEVIAALSNFIIRVANGDSKTTSNAEVKALAKVVLAYSELIRL